MVLDAFVVIHESATYFFSFFFFAAAAAGHSHTHTTGYLKLLSLDCTYSIEWRASVSSVSRALLDSSHTPATRYSGAVDRHWAATLISMILPLNLGHRHTPCLVSASEWPEIGCAWLDGNFSSTTSRSIHTKHTHTLFTRAHVSELKGSNGDLCSLLPLLLQSLNTCCKMLFLGLW